MAGKIKDSEKNDLHCLSINDKTGLVLAQKLKDAVNTLNDCEPSNTLNDCEPSMFTENENDKVVEILKDLSTYRTLALKVQRIKEKYRNESKH